MGDRPPILQERVSENSLSVISDFLSKVQGIPATGNATEHSYRSAFEALFAALGVTALNEPKRVKCGAPDFIISSGEIVIGHVEAKDLHIGIPGHEGQQQGPAGAPLCPT